jgi:signal transduction histidine kinase
MNGTDHSQARAPIVVTRRTQDEIEHLSHSLARREFGEVARALRCSIESILLEWRRRSLELMPGLNRLSVAEFDDSMAAILGSLASAMECTDAAQLRQIVEESPSHGVSRFAQRVTPVEMLAEERILRSVVVTELRRAMQRPLSDAEAASIHELLDVIGQHSVEELNRLRGEERDEQVLNRVQGLHRLADMGMLVAGLAHDAANLMLPLRSRLEGIADEALSESARDDVEGALLIARHLQDFVVNLRMLTVEGIRDSAQEPLDLAAWWKGVEPFYRKLLPALVAMRAQIPPSLPGPRIGAASLSQAMFNLMRNAEQSLRGSGGGGIRVYAAEIRGDGGGLHTVLTVEDDGPGMTPEVLSRCMEPFFSARPDQPGSGLGLAVVNTLIARAGGLVSIESPAPGSGRGVAVNLHFPAEERPV